MSNISMIKNQSQLINIDLSNTTENLSIKKSNLEIDKKHIKNSKTTLSSAKSNQKKLIKDNEENDKKYKALKKYGEVLQLVEKLLNLIPGDLENLSTEELEEKLKELLKTRKKHEMQLQFIFYQSLLTTLMNNLITIEKNYQSKTISSATALSDVQKTKHEIKSQLDDVPESLKPSFKEASHLVKLYEDSYSAGLSEKVSSNVTPTQLKESKLNVNHEIMLENLNNSTKEIINQVENLSTNLNNFEPHVNLDNLTKQLASTEEILSKEDWKPSDLDSAVVDLKNETISLTDKQIEINETNEKIEAEIKETSEKIEETSKLSFKSFSQETFEEINTRSEEEKEITQQIVEILEEDPNLSTTIGTQVANTIIAQAEADESFVTEVLSDPNSEIIFSNQFPTTEVIDSAEELKDNVQTLEEKRELLLKLEQEKETDDPEKKE